MVEAPTRAALLDRAAAEWHDRASAVRAHARAALADAEWSGPVVEAALDDALLGFDGATALQLADDARGGLDAEPDRPPVLVILPGNVIGPALAAAFCAAAAGARAVLKSAGPERVLAPLVANQFDRSGAPLAGTIDARYWKGGDAAIEAPAFAAARHIVILGSDETLSSLTDRVGKLEVRGYGTAFSIGFVAAGADFVAAARGAARDVCLFDQRGCMSPQTIYVQGDDRDALRYAHALAAALRMTGTELPRARITRVEAETLADRVRRFAITALPARTHGLDTLILGPRRDETPEFVVVVEAAGPPTLAGFGRIVSVKACADLRHAIACCDPEQHVFDSFGYAGMDGPDAIQAMAVFSRVCALGEMQRPPFGYRPQISDFV